MALESSLVNAVKGFSSGILFKISVQPSPGPVAKPSNTGQP